MVVGEKRPLAAASDTPPGAELRPPWALGICRVCRCRKFEPGVCGCCGWFTWAPDETDKGRGEENREVFGCELGAADSWSTVLGAARFTVLLGDTAEEEEEEEPCAAEFDCIPFGPLPLDQPSTVGLLGKYELSGGGGGGDDGDGDESRRFTAPGFIPTTTLPSESARLPLATADMFGVVVVAVVEVEVMVVVVEAVVD